MRELRAIVMRAGNAWTDTGIPRVAMVQAEACSSQVYQPMLHLVLQGSKTLSVGDQLLSYPEASYFIVPVDVPATGAIQSGAAGKPYLAASLTIPSALRRCWKATTGRPTGRVDSTWLPHWHRRNSSTPGFA